MCGAGVVCTLRWPDQFLYRDRRRWDHCIPTCISAIVSPRAMPSARSEKIWNLEARKKKIQITENFLDSIFLGIKEGFEQFVIRTPAGCVVCRTVKPRPREDAAGRVFVNSIRGTPRRLVPDDDPRGQQPLRIDVRPVRADLPPPIGMEPPKPHRVYIRNSVVIARFGYTPGCIGCAAAMTHGPSRDHTEQCRTRIIKAMSSDVALSHRRARQNVTPTR